MNRGNVIVRCAGCSTKNRVDKLRVDKNPVCGRCARPLRVPRGDGRPVAVTDQTFARDVLSHLGTVLLDCWAPWCGPCRMLAPVMEELASEYAGQIKIAKLNTDENPITASRYGIRSIPTMLLFRDGALVDTLVGALPKQDIVRRIQEVL